ncbi:MAG: hypothetical protein IJW82_07500, partial [Clostridia bacterium]|nr:hypothetical protein [Clostridia bacterium]
KGKARLYPIVFGQWKQRNKSIYGRGEVENLIPNQKAINFNLGMQILSAQDEAMGITVVKEDALRGQRITNEPGQVLTDYSKSGNGISFPQRQRMTSSSINLASSLAEMTRNVIGSGELMNG